MLEKYLPFLKPREKPKNPESENKGYIPDDSLFINPESLRTEAVSAGSLVSLSSSLIIFFSIALFVTLLAHLSINFMLNEQLREQKNILYKIEGYKDIEKDAAVLSNKIAYSKKTVDERKPLTTKISFIMERVPSGLKFDMLELKPDSFRISVKSLNTVVVTQMFLKWLQDGAVSEVVIEEALFSSSDGMYSVVLGGTFR